MPVLPVEPRRLNASERALLEHILSAEFAGASALRGQLESTEVVAIWTRCCEACRSDCLSSIRAS
jgi:hypothetical protein